MERRAPEPRSATILGVGNPLIDIAAAVIAFGLILGTIGLTRRRDLYGQIGAGGTSLGDGAPDEPPRGSPEAARERELEIRQMLQARSERMQRRGEPALDVDAEIARLLDAAPTPAAAERGERSDVGGGHRHDPELVEELRQLATARSQRRVRDGLPPLDVQAEVARALAELEA